jgi:hypothetical protein
MVPVGLLDRLDALDRRLGLAPKPPKKPPARWRRWLAGHRWAAALVWATAMLATWVVPDLLSEAELSPVAVLIQVPGAFLFGFVVATVERNRCEAWDQGREA